MVVVTQAFDADVARRLLQMRVADFLVKPVAPVELVRTCARVAQGPAATAETTEAQIYTFLPAVGGVGVTTLAIQTAMLLLNSGQRGRATTCLVDLDFQHGACADYLDLEPRLDLERDRAAAGAARPATARSDAVAACVRPGGDRGAEPAGRDAHRSIPTW